MKSFSYVLSNFIKKLVKEHQVPGFGTTIKILLSFAQSDFFIYNFLWEVSPYI